MNTKTSADYQRVYRKRLKDQGLVKREIWIRPEHTDRAHAYEKTLREAGEIADPAGQSGAKRAPWTTAALYGELFASALVKQGRASVELIEGLDPTLLVLMQEFGDLPVYLSVAGEQIVVESVLWPVSDIVDQAAFNDAVLRTHKYFPLSSICLDQRATEDYYLMFGSLGSSVSLLNIVQEIEVLSSNVIHAVEAYSEFLKDNISITSEQS